jgi:hypothetical protein
MKHLDGPIDGHGHSGVTDLESYLRVHARAIKAAGIPNVTLSDPVKAYVNHGRWVVDCVCRGAGLTSPEFGVSACFDCGRIYTGVTFPANHKDIERVLLQRSNKSNRNWVGETVDELTQESA